MLWRYNIRIIQIEQGVSRVVLKNTKYLIKISQIFYSGNMKVFFRI